MKRALALGCALSIVAILAVAWARESGRQQEATKATPRPQPKGAAAERPARLAQDAPEVGSEFTAYQPPAGEQPAGGNANENEKKEPKSRLVRALMKQMDELDDAGEGTAEERREIRRLLMQADDELYRSTGKAAILKIKAANKRAKAFRVRKSRRSGAIARPAPAPPAVPAKAAPAPPAGKRPTPPANPFGGQ